MDHESWIADLLADLESRGIRRDVRPLPSLGGKFQMDGRTVLNFSSNDYLNFSAAPELARAAKDAIDRYGCGATASRLMAGTADLHDELERNLAAFKGCEAAVVFTSGYMANVGAIGALVGRDDAVFCDRLDHASMIDGVSLSGAKLFRYRHCDPEDLDSMLASETAFRRRLVVTDTLFSMDGEIAPIGEIADVCERRGAALMVDEAHATGVFGANGAGVAEAADPDCGILAHMGTLSKALGGCGGFIAGSRALRDLLLNRARSFIYTTGLPPASAASALAALELLRARPGLGAELLHRAEHFRKRLSDAGFQMLGSRSQIIPIIVGDNDKAVAWSRSLSERGVLAVAVRPPTVPVGTARLRLSVTLAHDEADLDEALEVLVYTGRGAGIL
ncbi:MAG: 8-amino-7-oxononanoate synthase [Armatimonadota bacterium]|nr:8-amino-7-oxononanoate synthase [Armatimonadota bacterium]